MSQVTSGKPSKVIDGFVHRPEPTERYLYVKELHKSVLEYGYSLARWVMASLLVLNGGALVALSGLLKDYPAAAAAGGPKLVVGAMLAILTGIFAWLNCNAVADANSDRLNFVTYDTQDPKSADIKDKVAWVLAAGAFASAFASLYMFGAGCEKVADSVRVQQASEAGRPN